MLKLLKLKIEIKTRTKNMMYICIDVDDKLLQKEKPFGLRGKRFLNIKLDALPVLMTDI